MALEAQNNPFTSVLMVGAADPEAIGDTDPSAGSYRLVMGTDDALYILDETGTATPVAGAAGAVATDAIWDAAGDLVQGTGANTAAKLGAGTAGQVLTSGGAAAANVWAGFHGVRVTKSTAFSHTSSGSLVAVTFDTEDYDTDGYHTGSNSTLVVPTGLGGYYHIHGSFEWDTNTTGGDRGIQLYRNGTTEIAWDRVAPTAIGIAHAVSTTYLLAATDTIELRAYQNSGGTRTGAARANTQPLLAMHRIGV